MLTAICEVCRVQVTRRLSVTHSCTSLLFNETDWLYISENIHFIINVILILVDKFIEKFLLTNSFGSIAITMKVVRLRVAWPTVLTCVDRGLQRFAFFCVYRFLVFPSSNSRFIIAEYSLVVGPLTVCENICTIEINIPSSFLCLYCRLCNQWHTVSIFL